MKTVIITGASRGIGRALAEKFLANGDLVIGTSTKETGDCTHRTDKALSPSQKFVLSKRAK